MEGRGKSRRRSPYRVWKRRGSALLAMLLTLSLMLGDISGLSRVVMAGQGTVREEFRIRREDILKAAEEAIENGEPLSEPLAITSEEEKTEEKYQKILPADGSVYEIFPDIEQVKEVDSLELRIFIRLAEGADPASYTLTGDETLVFLYVNGGDVTAEGRVNIDGYVSEFTKVAAFEGEEEPMQPGGDTGAVSGNGAAGSGNGSGNGAAGGSGTAGSEAVGSSDAENDTAAAESESNGSDSMDPEDSAADLDGETEAESEEVGNGTSEDGMSPEETLPAETQEPSQEPESGAAEETEAAEQPSGETPDDETPGDQTDGSEADGTASDENTAEAGTGSADEDKETAGNTENSDAADDSADNENDVKESDAADEASEADEGSAEDNSQADPADTENENAEADKEDGAEPEKSDTAENADSNAADEGNEAGSTVTLSLRNIQKVAASLASPSETETPEADGSREEQEESEADEEDSYYEDNGDPVDEEDAAEAEDEEDIFKKTHDLKGRKYDEAVLDKTVTVRAFAAGMEDAGFNREDLLEGSHQLTYTVAEGEARLIYTPEYVRDEAVVTFGIIPAEGMEVYQVTANGEVLAETEETAAIASASQAKRAKASSSDADYDEERAVYYQIPQVLEDQTVEIQVVEEGYNDHPAFLQSRTVNGVTVTVSAEEGILPAGTELQVEEVTVQIQDALKEKVENEAEDNTAVTSVIAYDINLVLDGEKLDNSWSENGYVDVTFSGTRIEEMTDNSNKIEVVAVDDNQQEVLSAKNADTVTAETVELESIHNQDVEGTAVDEVSFEAEHFTIYAVVGQDYIEDKYTMAIYEELTLRLDRDWDWVVNASWESDEPDVAEVSSDRRNPREATVTAKKPGKAKITCTYGRNKEYFYITVADYIEVKVYSRYNGLLEYDYLNTTQGAGDFGPSGDDTAYTTLTIDLTKMEGLIKKDHPQFEVYQIWDSGWKKNFYYYSVACSTYGYSYNASTYEAAVKQFYTEYIFPSMTEESQEKMQSMFPQDTYVGYVLKKESGEWHLDGYFDAKYILEVYNENEGTTQPVQTETSEGPLNYSRVQEIVAEKCSAEITWESIDYAAKSQKGYFTLDGSNYEVTVTFGMEGNDADVSESDGQIIYDEINGVQEGYLAQFVFHYERTKKSIPDTTFIRVTKEFKKADGTKLTAEEISTLGGGEDSFTITLNEESILSLNEEALPNPYKWEVPGLSTGRYAISESSYNLEGYGIQAVGNDIPLTEDKQTGSLTGNVQTQPAGITVNLTNHKVDFPISGISLQESSDQVNLIAGKLNTDQWIVWTSQKLSANERDKVIAALSQDGEVNGSEYFFYSGSATLNDGITYGAITLRYENGKLVTDHANDWEQIVSACFAYTEVPEIQIVNTYTPVTIDFAVKKILRNGGHNQNHVSQVSFQLLKYNKLTESYVNYGEVRFVQENDKNTAEGYAIFEGIPAGDYQLQEKTTADGYQLLTAPIEIKIVEENGSLVVKVNENGSWEKVEIESDGKNIPVYTVYNTPGAELPETGGPGLIMMERFGWMLLLLALVGADVQLFSRRRRKEQ